MICIQPLKDAFDKLDEWKTALEEMTQVPYIGNIPVAAGIVVVSGVATAVALVRIVFAALYSLYERNVDEFWDASVSFGMGVFWVVKGCAYLVPGLREYLEEGELKHLDKGHWSTLNPLWFLYAIEKVCCGVVELAMGILSTLFFCLNEKEKIITNYKSAFFHLIGGVVELIPFAKGKHVLRC